MKGLSEKIIINKKDNLIHIYLIFYFFGKKFPI